MAICQIERKAEESSRTREQEKNNQQGVVKLAKEVIFSAFVLHFLKLFKSSLIHKNVENICTPSDRNLGTALSFSCGK